MGLVREIAHLAGVAVTSVGALELVDISDFSKFVAACRTGQISIIGIEGFYIIEGRVEPEMDAVADFSDPAEAASSWDAAEDFLRNFGNSGLKFEFTLEEKIFSP